jgi:hypothetical protein
MAKGSWLNTTKVIEPNIAKPCKKLGYCPYGQLVEEFPLLHSKSKLSCPTFGHDCPVHYHAEGGPKYTAQLRKEIAAAKVKMARAAKRKTPTRMVSRLK